MHFYGKCPTWYEQLLVAIFDKLPVAVSQVLGYSLLAFLTRPFPKNEDELQANSSCVLAFFFLLLAVVTNFGLLRASGPHMSLLAAWSLGVRLLS